MISNKKVVDETVIHLLSEAALRRRFQLHPFFGKLSGQPVDHRRLKSAALRCSP